MNYPFLSAFGLTEKEIALYELLLSRGQMLVGDIIKESKLKRATAYQSLYSLEKKGLVSQVEAGKKIHFKPEPPTQLLQLANTHLHNYEESHQQLSSIISSLDSKYILAVQKPVISLFEGIDGLKEIYNDTLSVQKPIYAALTVEDIDQELYDWLTHTYVKKRAQLKIPAYVLVAKSREADSYMSKNEDEFRTTKVVDKSKYPFQHEIDIYGDKVAFVNYKKGGPLLGVVIHHPDMAKTMKALFDIAWDGTKD